MSDLSFSPSPPPASGSRKRKSTGKTSAPKRARKSQPDPYATAKDLIRTVLASPDTFELPDGDQEYRNLVTTIAQYAKDLEGSVAAAASTGRAAPAPKTQEEIATEVKRLSGVITSGITKQMNWRPTCREGRGKYAFDGLCTDPRVFGALLGLDGPPSFKTKKFPSDEFENLVGRIRASARYSRLKLTSEVNVHWNSETGEFKMSGRYGV